MITDLVAFMRACLDEDEQAAQAAQPGPWTAYTSGGVGVGGSDARGVADRRAFDRYATYETGEDLAVGDALHIARWDPARVLAEVAAKRAILEMIEQGDLHDGYGDDTAVTVLCLLAQPHRNKPGWRDEWSLEQ